MHFYSLLLVAAGCLLLPACQPSLHGHNGKRIDRKKLVTRHNVINEGFDSLSSLSVGNGQFAMTVDATGLQSFPAYYRKGGSLGTFSDWGWHSFPDSAGYKYGETLREVDFYGRKVTYDVQWKEPERKRRAADFFRQNPHRLNLGIIGMEISRSDGQPALMNDIGNVGQKLDLWEGTIRSRFTVEGRRVEVTTLCDQETDRISVKIVSPLLKEGRIQLKLSFPYPSGGHVDDGCDWNAGDRHRTRLYQAGNHARISRVLDSTRYFIYLQWNGEAESSLSGKNSVDVKPLKGSSCFEFSALFTPEEDEPAMEDFTGSREKNRIAWKKFWESGGAVDFSGSTDPRASELERRVVLSQYLTRIQCAGMLPPQETGLTFNSWYGKFHIEMHWWHAVHFALWDRPRLMEKSLDWYSRIFPVAQQIARRQGFNGVRWPKMVGPDGLDSPSSVGSYLIWQQPHIIYLAELLYRHYPGSTTLNKYRDLVFSTADFMAGYAQPDKRDSLYHLGPWLIPAQERLPAAATTDPPFELAYWHWGLNTAQIWRQRLGLAPNPHYDSVIARLPVLYQNDSLYLAAGSAPDSYSNPAYTGDHPAVLGALGMLPPSRLVDQQTMKSTFLYIQDHWDWKSTWGWDFPMIAMTATRLGMPEKAVDALLMPAQKNTYLKNGHNYQDQRLRIYLPGNGGLLSAVAMMCAGYDGCTTDTPGFPKDGAWRVRWEGLARMP